MLKSPAGGFAGGQSNQVGGFVEVSRSDAHAWVEVHYRDAGWVRYDPTPPDLRLAGSIAASSSLTELASALEFWWFRNVVDFDRGHQARALKKAWRAWRDWRREAMRQIRTWSAVVLTVALSLQWAGGGIDALAREPAAAPGRTARAATDR